MFLQTKINKELEKEGSSEDNDLTRPKISQAISNCLQKWFYTLHLGTNIQAAFKQCVYPKNIVALKVVQLNQEFKKKMNHPDEIYDQHMKWLCNAVPKAAQPMTKAWATLSE